MRSRISEVSPVLEVVPDSLRNFSFVTSHVLLPAELACPSRRVQTDTANFPLLHLLLSHIYTATLLPQRFMASHFLTWHLAQHIVLAVHLITLVLFPFLLDYSITDSHNRYSLCTYLCRGRSTLAFLTSHTQARSSMIPVVFAAPVSHRRTH